MHFAFSDLLVALGPAVQEGRGIAVSSSATKSPAAASAPSRESYLNPFRRCFCNSFSLCQHCPER